MHESQLTRAERSDLQMSEQTLPLPHNNFNFKFKTLHHINLDFNFNRFNRLYKEYDKYSNKY